MIKFLSHCRFGGFFCGAQLRHGAAARAKLVFLSPPSNSAFVTRYANVQDIILKIFYQVKVSINAFKFRGYIGV
jgi:hypothetical protein